MRLFFLTFSLLVSATTLAASPIPSNHKDPSPTPSSNAFARGDFEQAVRDLNEALRAAEAAGDTNKQADLLARRSEAYQRLGLYERAIQDAQAALALTGDDARSAKLLGTLGNAYLLAGRNEKAREYLEAGIASARKADDAAALATSLNNFGNLLSAESKADAALGAYRESADLARKAGKRVLAATALINSARTLLARAVERADPQVTAGATDAAKLLDEARSELDAAPASRDKAYGLISIGELWSKLNTGRPAQASQRKAVSAFSDAAKIGETLKDERASSYALGYLGQLYEEQRRYAEASELTRRALFLAQQAQAPEILYLWEWQSGRLARAQNDIDTAIASYRRAVHHLQAVRNDLSATLAGNRSLFRERVGPVYFELADLLLKRGGSLNNAQSVQRDLLDARGTVELLKAAELRDYFQDDCVTALQSRTAGVDRVAPRTAVLYPIILPDRIELLLSLADEIKQYTVAVDSRLLTDEVRAFRKKLEKRTTREYLPHAQKLYDWLVRPLEKDLQAQRIETIVFVPDGALRTVPMAPLHDGKQFLVQKYALATTPGLALTDLRPLKRDNVQSLLSGLTEPVQGFPALPNVARELDNVSDIYGGKVLRDREFVVPALEQELSATSYSIVHIASHGEFDSDPKKSFLLAFDQKLSMDKLEQMMQFGQYRRDPVELLTLSACETAAGDDRAALGLAGVAIKAGARSALATLWFINDQASSILVSDFYRALNTPAASKAEALQDAQKKMLDDKRFAHPGYWAPFLLIGSWL